MRRDFNRAADRRSEPRASFEIDLRDSRSMTRRRETEGLMAGKESGGVSWKN